MNLLAFWAPGVLFLTQLCVKYAHSLRLTFMPSKFLSLIKSYQYHLFLAICITLISFISYNLGRISINDKSPLKITEGANIYKAATVDINGDNNGAVAPKVTPKPLDLRVVVSKASDSKKYHYSFCNTWKKIKVENQLWFNSDKEAEAAGYTLAGNCTK